MLNGRQVIIAGPNKQARLRAGKDALDLLQQYRTDEDLAAYIDRGEETAHRHCVSSQYANANAWGSQCWPGAASASSSLGQPVPGQPVPEEEPLKQNLASRSASSKVACPNSPSESYRMRRSGSRSRKEEEKKRTRTPQPAPRSRRSKESPTIQEPLPLDVATKVLHRLLLHSGPTANHHSIAADADVETAIWQTAKKNKTDRAIVFGMIKVAMSEHQRTALKQSLASSSAFSKVEFPNRPSESCRMGRSGSRPRKEEERERSRTPQLAPRRRKNDSVKKWDSQCFPRAASASNSLGQPVLAQLVPEEESQKQQLASRSASSKVAFPNSPSKSSRMGRSGSRPRVVQPVPVQPVPGAASANAWGSQSLPAAATTCLGQPMPASRQQAAPLQSIAFAIHILAKGEAGKVWVQQLRQTLRQNLKDNELDQNKVGFIVVDFGSSSEHEGDTVDSIIKEQAQALDNGFLKYFCTQPLEHFHHCVCKNTSLNIACKLQYDFVVSLDADGFTGPRGGVWLLDQVNGAMRSKQKLVGTWQFGKHGDGAYGRIGLQPSVWRKFGFFDESLEQASCHDRDIVTRLMPHHKVEVLQLKDTKFNRHIPNSKDITSSAFLSYPQQFANNQRSLSAKDKNRVFVNNDAKAPAYGHPFWRWIPYLGRFTDNLSYRVPVIPFLSFSFHTQNQKTWPDTPKQTKRKKQNKRETPEFCKDIGDRYLPPPGSGDHSSRIRGVVDLAGVCGRSYQLQPPRARCGGPKMTKRQMRDLFGRMSKDLLKLFHAREVAEGADDAVPPGHS